MDVTDEMVRKAMVECGIRRISSFSSETRSVLRAALADVPEPVNGPFVLSDFEKGLLDKHPTWAEYNRLAHIIRRAVATIGAATAALTDVQRATVERLRCPYGPNEARELIAIIDAHFPPPPKVRTVDELVEDAKHATAQKALDAIDELAELARKGGAK